MTWRIYLAAAVAALCAANSILHIVSPEVQQAIIGLLVAGGFIDLASTDQRQQKSIDVNQRVIDVHDRQISRLQERNQ